MNINKITSAIIIALCLGVIPQTQGMNYFKAGYNTFSAWGKKAVITVKETALARIAAIVNHIVPQPPKNSDSSERSLNRIQMIVNHLDPEQKEVSISTQDKNALKRAQVLMSHITPVPTHGDSKPDEIKLSAFEKQVQTILAWFYNDTGLNLIGPIINSEDIFDVHDNKIGTLYFHKNDASDQTPLITRFVNNEGNLVGFCIASINSETKSGAIAYLHINQEERRSGLGKILLAHVTRELYKFGCRNFHGRAQSFDLPAQENEQQMQTKLEGFYGQFGAESLDGSKSRLGLSFQ